MTENELYHPAVRIDVELEETVGDHCPEIFYASLATIVKADDPIETSKGT